MSSDSWLGIVIWLLAGLDALLGFLTGVSGWLLGFAESYQ